MDAGRPTAGAARNASIHGVKIDNNIQLFAPVSDVGLSAERMAPAHRISWTAKPQTTVTMYATM